MSRIDNTVRNAKFAMAGQVVSILIGFISRKIFVVFLGAEYLGLGGLFSNVLMILTLAELGVGRAINYSLYKPLAERDEKKLITIMDFYRKVYLAIGLIIFALGLLLTPFLDFFLKDPPSIPHLRLIFLMFVTNTSISYFFSYKRSLIFTDQKGYIATFYRYLFYLVLNIIQVVILVTTRNYLLYLSAQLVMTFAENLAVSRKADKLYPFLKSKVTEKLDSGEKTRISRNTFAMVLHKVGTTVVMGTDNLLISKFVGLLEVGYYSNYNLILYGLRAVFEQLFHATGASIGHLGATESKEKRLFVFESLDLFGSWIYSFSSICLVILANPFISLWLGDQYLLSNSFVIVIVINFYVTGMRQSVISFKDALGLFWYDRYRPLFESLLNLVLSIILVNVLGLVGIFIGTILSSLLTCFWVEPRVLYKYGFNLPVSPYFFNYAKKTVVMLITGYITWLASRLFNQAGIPSFAYKLAVCLIIPNLFFYLLLRKDERFKYLVAIFRTRILRKN